MPLFWHTNNIGYGNVIEADSVSSLVTHTNGASTTTNLIEHIETK